MLNTSTAIVLMVLGQSGSSGRPSDWRTPSLVASVREADKIVERAALAVDAFAPGPERSPRDTDPEWQK